MRITTLWSQPEPGEAPTLLEAYDEYTEDVHGGVPDFFAEQQRIYPSARVLVLTVPESVIHGLFAVPHINALVEQ